MGIIRKKWSFNLSIKSYSNSDTYLAKEKYKKALEILKSIKNADDTHKKIPDVLNLCIEAANLAPGLSEPYIILADIADQFGCTEDSIALLNKAIEVNPENISLNKKYLLIKKEFFDKITSPKALTFSTKPLKQLEIKDK